MQTAHLPCVATGDPAPTIIWRRVGHTIGSDKMEFHDADTDTDTDTDVLARKSRVSDVRMYLDVSGESESVSVSVSVSASWNASLYLSGHSSIIEFKFASMVNPDSDLSGKSIGRLTVN